MTARIIQDIVPQKKPTSGSPKPSVVSILKFKEEVKVTTPEIKIEPKIEPKVEAPVIKEEPKVEISKIPPLKEQKIDEPKLEVTSSSELIPKLIPKIEPSNLEHIRRSDSKGPFMPVGLKTSVQKPPFPKKLLFIIALAIIAVAGAILIINKYFSYAHVYVTPKTQAYTLNHESFTATKATNAPLGFEIMIVEGVDKRDATFSEKKDALTKATGTVVIYNAYSTKPQKLLIHTKLVDDEKRIYLTDKAVNVPGYTGAGTKIVPGSVEVGITANGTGPDYNGDPRDFTLVGFAGTAKATKIYARSKTPLSGGQAGVVYMLSPEEKGKASVDASTALYNKLFKKLQAQVPPGYMVYAGSMQFTKKMTDEVFQSPTPVGTVTISGSLSAPIFKESEITEAIVRAAYPNVKADELAEITSPKMQDLVFAYTDAGATISKNTDSIKFNFTGGDTLLWHPLLDVLKGKLAGADKESLNTIFMSDPGIAKARAVFRPPWQKYVPKEIGHIKISLE
jgi:hypothetical protein